MVLTIGKDVHYLYMGVTYGAYHRQSCTLATSEELRNYFPASASRAALNSAQVILLSSSLSVCCRMCCKKRKETVSIIIIFLDFLIQFFIKLLRFLFRPSLYVVCTVVKGVVYYYVRIISYINQCRKCLYTGVVIKCLLN